MSSYTAGRKREGGREGQILSASWLMLAFTSHYDYDVLRNANAVTW